MSLAPVTFAIHTRRPAIEAARAWRPRSELGLTILRALPHLPPDLAHELVERISASAVVETSIRAKVIRNLGLVHAGILDRRELRIEDYGIVSRRVVTDAGVAFLVGILQNLETQNILKFHGIGTGTNAESVSDTDLQTELTTEYNPNNTRATGTTSSSAANVYQTVGTNTLDSGTPAITEHGIFSASARGSGTLLDRSVFAAINLIGANGDGLQVDYRFTIASGG